MKIGTRDNAVGAAAPRILVCLLALAGGLGISGCAQLTPGTMSSDEILKEFYASQIDTLSSLDHAYDQLGQEYYVLDIEYQSMGRPELADAARKRAERFQAERTQLQTKIAEIQMKSSRAKRSEKPTSVKMKPAPAPAKSSKSAPKSAPARKTAPERRAAPAPAAQPAPAAVAPPPAPEPAPAPQAIEVAPPQAQPVEPVPAPAQP